MGDMERGGPKTSSAWIGLRSEWSLWVFSVLAIWLVAWMMAKTASHQAIQLNIFILIGVVAMGTSALHLGRRMRIYRSVLNLRGSWISREVLLFVTFFVGSCLLALFDPSSHWIAWIVAMIGLGALFSMDMVYRIPGSSLVTVPHSAMATLTALLLVGLLQGNAILAATVAAVKLCLYVERWARHRRTHPIAGCIRIAAGFALPLCLWIAGVPAGSPLLVGSAFLGEMIDRAQFYSELKFLTPGLQIEIDLERFPQEVQRMA
jgi:DMSO reductase anchor subunit